MSDPIYFVAWFHRQARWRQKPNQRSQQPCGLAAHPSSRFDVNGNHFQMAMLAYNLNCWLMLFNGEPQADAAELRDTTLATSRLRFLFMAAKIWRHAGRTGVSYGDHYCAARRFRGEGYVRALDRPSATDWAACQRLSASDGACPALKKNAAWALVPCIEIYALTASATKHATSERALAGLDSQEDDEA